MAYQHPLLLSVNEMKQFGADPFSAEQLVDMRTRAQAQQAATATMENLAGFQAGRGGPAKYDMMRRRGFNTTNPELDQSYDPLALQQQMLDAANLKPLVSGLSPEGFSASEQVTQQIESMAPQMADALKNFRNVSMYEGENPNFYVKRLRIAMQRKREHDMYALV